MVHEILLRASDNIIEIQGLTDPLTNQVITTAYVEAVLKDKLGNEVAGQTWPLILSHVFASPGTYRGTLAMELVVTANETYLVEVFVDAGATQRQTFFTPIVVRDAN